MRNAKDVRIDGKRSRTERYREDDACGLSPDSRKRFERLAIFGNVPAVLVGQSTSSGDDVFSLRPKKTTGFNQTFHLGQPRRRQCLRRWICGKERWRRQVDARIGALRR